MQQQLRLPLVFLATIGPDLVAAGGPAALAQVRLIGAPAAREAGATTKLSFGLKLPAPAGPLLLRRPGPLPMYATAYRTHWSPAPEPAARPLTVATALGGQAGIFKMIDLTSSPGFAPRYRVADYA